MQKDVLTVVGITDVGCHTSLPPDRLSVSTTCQISVITAIGYHYYRWSPADITAHAFKLPHPFWGRSPHVEVPTKFDLPQKCLTLL